MAPGIGSSTPAYLKTHIYVNICQLGIVTALCHLSKPIKADLPLIMSHHPIALRVFNICISEFPYQIDCEFDLELL